MGIDVETTGRTFYLSSCLIGGKLSYSEVDGPKVTELSTKDLKLGIQVPELLTQICPGQTFCHLVSGFQFVKSRLLRGMPRLEGFLAPTMHFILVLL